MLMMNSVFRKTIGNMRKHRNIKNQSIIHIYLFIYLFCKIDQPQKKKTQKYS